MSAPFQPGDVVVCVNARPCPCYPEATVPKQGALYRVTEAQDFHDPNTDQREFCVRVDRDNCVYRGKVGWYAHWRFRKIDDEEYPLVLERLKALGKQRELAE